MLRGTRQAAAAVASAAPTSGSTSTGTAASAVTSRRPLLGLTWAHLLNDGAANYIPGVLPAVLVALHEPIQIAGVLIAALTVGQACQPAIGFIADRVGGRSLVVTGLLLSSLGGGLVAAAPNTVLLVVLLLLIGLGSAFFHPQALAGVRTLIRGRTGFLTSAFLVGGELGRGIWPTVASVVVADLGLHSLWIIALPGVATVPLLWHYAPRIAPVPRTEHPVGISRRGRPIALLLGYQGVRALVTFGLVTFIPILWHLRGKTLVTGASIITTMIVVGVVGNLWGGHLTDRLGRRPVLIVSGVATSACIFPLVYLEGAWVWISAALLGIALFLTASTTVLIGQDILPENRSMGSGLAIGFANGIGALAVLVIGFVVNDHDLMPVFWLLAALGLASTATAVVMPQSLLG